MTLFVFAIRALLVLSVHQFSCFPQLFVFFLPFSSPFSLSLGIDIIFSNSVVCFSVLFVCIFTIQGSITVFYCKGQTECNTWKDKKKKVTAAHCSQNMNEDPEKELILTLGGVLMLLSCYNSSYRKQGSAGKGRLLLHMRRVLHRGM